MKMTLAAMTAALTLLTTIPAAHADNVSGCVQGKAPYGLRVVLRTICDGEIKPDGSWWRSRGFYASADYNVWYTPSFGYEGARIPELDVSEEYLVWPDNIPFGEPGHIVGGYTP